jgi:hypothetical protein
VSRKKIGAFMISPTVHGISRFLQGFPAIMKNQEGNSFQKGITKDEK